MTDQAFPDALPSQYRLHWYVIERVLGQGGFGITYLARDPNLDQTVAIKEYLPIEVATRRPDATVRSRTDNQRDRYRWGLDRFIGEARTLARFDHPNIVRVLSVFEFNDTAYMVMRFEEGDNLASVLERRGTLPESELKKILLPVLDGLKLVHEAGFIHRDIKPDNIHIRRDGTPVLLDFGSARHALGRSRELTILVAPGYAPFEQYYSSSDSQGPWTDIYGLGATCYRAIAGIAPMDAIERSKGILGSVHDVLIPASAVGKGRYSDSFLAAVDHALRFADKDRPQSIEEWKRELLTEVPPAVVGVVGAVAAPVPEPADQVARPAENTPLPPTTSVVPAASAGTLPERRREPPPTVAMPPAAPPYKPILWLVAGAVVTATGIAFFVMFKPDHSQAPSPTIANPVVDSAASKPTVSAPAKVDAVVAPPPAVAGVTTAQPSPSVMANKPVAPVKNTEPAVRVPKKVSPAPVEPMKPAAAPEITPNLSPMALPAPAPPAAAGDDPLAAAERSIAGGDYVAALPAIKHQAAAGNARAQIMLGDLYAKGLGMPKNCNAAYMWYGVAAHHGLGDGTTRKNQIIADCKLQSPEVRQAEQQIRAWKARTE